MAPRKQPRRHKAHTAGLTGSKPVRPVALTGGRARDGAAVSWLAGARRLHLRNLHVEAYLMDMITRRGAAEKPVGDELSRRRRMAITEPVN